jgi:hypothetical protein
MRIKTLFAILKPSFNVDNQFIKDSTANPKDIFETTQEYNQRISNIISNYEKNKYEQINPLQQQLTELESNYYLFPTNIKVSFDLNKYNADLGNWAPAIQNGRNVNSYKRQPLTFVVSE